MDKNCGIIEQSHIDIDTNPDGDLKNKIGSTGSGTGPANADRAMRVLKMARDIKQLDDITIDVPGEINKTIRSGGNVLVEGTQGTFLSLWHGTYPYVTSKDVTASGICADVGIGPTVVSQVVMVVKAYVTRVGTGPLNNELSEEETIRRGWAEKGTVTGRARRAADFDYETGRRAVMLNGATQIALTKLDIVFPECAKMTSYDTLSAQAKAFVEKIENGLGVPVTIIGTGAEDIAVIDRRK